MKLTFYPAPQPNKSGVLVVPGGGYGYVSLEKEGIKPAAWLNERGFDAWVLEYANPADGSPAPTYPAPLDDAREAVRRIRAEGRVTGNLGIWGWSAGGHLSAITATILAEEAAAAAGEEGGSPALVLDFAILAYPVISMEPGTTHLGSLHNLLGADAPAELRAAMCAESRVTARTPPTFLFHTSNDEGVPVENSLLFASALARAGVLFSALVLPDGAHGAGLALDDPKLTWTGELERWLGGFKG
ncbi:Alpha/Beta hydrolase protein [Xylariales sp. PMI_506]|nr:Alpha/Beta hydrolase protein [Xylariales sp. PMI_506]